MIFVLVDQKCKTRNADLKWLKGYLETVIIEYDTVSMVQGKRLTPTLLKCYKSDGVENLKASLVIFMMFFRPTQNNIIYLSESLKSNI
jgi:hypothetical protein